MKPSRHDMLIDAALYSAIAFLGVSQAYLGGDEAAKYIEPEMKFWINYGLAVGVAVTGALKMFRSGTFTAFKETKATKPNP